MGVTVLEGPSSLIILSDLARPSASLGSDDHATPDATALTIGNGDDPRRPDTAPVFRKGHAV